MKNMKVKYLLALLLIVCSVATGYAQQITVKGQVWDEVLNEPLIGVNVSVKGTTNGVITDLDGNFTIKVQKNQVLIFSFIGYKDVEIVVKPAANRGSGCSRLWTAEESFQCGGYRDD